MARKLKPLSRGERAVVNRKKNPISKASRDELRRLAHNLTWGNPERRTEICIRKFTA